MSDTILIIEDELSLQNIVAAYFRKEGFNVITANDGLDGLEKFTKNRIDIVCSDVMMPNINGWDVVKSIRNSSDIPVIMMTALSDEENQLKGYDLEIDDYITKPFSPQILVAKVKNLLKRYNKTFSNKENLVSFGLMQLNIDSRVVKVEDKEIPLSKTEFDLLVYLVKNKSIALDRVTILDEVWGMDVYVEERVVDTFIKTLRKKLGNAGKYIKTIFGVGYKFEVD